MVLEKYTIVPFILTYEGSNKERISVGIGGDCRGVKEATKTQYKQIKKQFPQYFKDDASKINTRRNHPKASASEEE